MSKSLRIIIICYFLGFEIFNPETDDLDSEDENDDDDEEEEDEDRSSSDSSSQESVVSAPNKSENEKLEMMRQTQSLDDPTQHQGLLKYQTPCLSLCKLRIKLIKHRIVKTVTSTSGPRYLRTFNLRICVCAIKNWLF